MEFRAADETAIAQFVWSLPFEDPGFGDWALLARAVEASTVSAALYDGNNPIALLGVSQGRAWMHSLPRFRCPIGAFRMMRRKFREWSQGGDVVCAMASESGRPVRIMGLIAPVSVRDGVASFVLKGGANVP